MDHPDSLQGLGSPIPTPAGDIRDVCQTQYQVISLSLQGQRQKKFSLVLLTKSVHHYNKKPINIKDIYLFLYGGICLMQLSTFLGDNIEKVSQCNLETPRLPTCSMK